MEQQMAVENVGDKAAGLGLPGVTVDGIDLFAVHQATQEAVERARTGHGPTLIEAKTYRVGPHFSGESDHYRKDREEELRRWQKRDPIELFRTVLLEKGISKTELDAIDANAKTEMDRASNKAKEDTFPSADSLFADVTIENKTEQAS